MSRLEAWLWRHPLFFGMLFAVELLIAMVGVSVLVHWGLR